MVNGNYIVYGDKPSSESEIVEDHVHSKSIEKKTNTKNNKRKLNRTANDLQRTLNMAQLDNETDSVKFEKKIKEPKLLRYVSTSEVEEHYMNDRFETYCIRSLSDDSPKRFAFKKKPKNPSDGSMHYTYSRSSSTCSSPGGNLPTISEHAEHFGTIRPRGYHSPPSKRRSEFENKLDKYFAQPRELKKFVAKGTHPDSLYRVSSAVTDESKLARAMRLLRWPLALLVVCVALAIFVYFLMPDSMDMDNDSVNMTLWEAASIAGAARKTAKISDKGTGEHVNNTAKQSSKTPEIDFYEDNERNVDVNLLLEKLGNTETTKNLPIPPVFPSHISPEVQYGNDDNIRKPKILNDQNDRNSVASSTFKPHITLKPEKPLAIYFKENNAGTTERVAKSSTNDLTSSEDDDDDDNSYSVVTDSHTKYQYETTNHELNTDPEPPPRVSHQPVKANGKVNFTSGHSKLFGISLEEAEKYHPSTEGPLYNTRVSPTLPVWRDGDDSTTSKYPLEGQPQCRSTSLQLCRGILPYDLAMNDNVDINSQIPHIERLLATNCSDRIRHFICPIFEPECSAAPNPPRLPCYNLCKAVADSCAPYITPSINYLFNCGNYPRDRCMTAGAPCNSNEFECDDNSCIPNDWTCDGNKDCPLGEDESLCRECRPDEFRCTRGECIQRQWLCDGYTDCSNAEDESPANCVTQSYTSHQNEAGEELAGSAPAPAIRRFNDKLSSHRSAYPSRNADQDSSKELLMTSDSTNALKRNYTRRPSLARLSPYSRVQKTTEPPKANDIKELENSSEVENKTVAEEAKQMDKSEDLLSHLDKSIIKLEKVLNIDFKKVAKENSRNNEANKTESSTRSVSQEDYSQSAHVSPCPEGELRCVDGRCITLAQLCDGTVDCTDHADEDNCYT